MHYTQSLQIKNTIEKARNILITVHRKPDFDAVGSAIAMREACILMKKNVTLVCPTQIADCFSFINAQKIIQVTDFAGYDFSAFDCIIVLDSGNMPIITGSKDVVLPVKPTILIDHHKTNSIDADIRLVEDHAAATAEVVFHMFEDWKLEINKEIATALFSGIAGDTVFFKYMENPIKTFNAVNTLIQKGADSKLFISSAYNNYSFSFIRVMGILLDRMKYESKRKFVWSSMSYDEYVRLGKPEGVRECTADMFFQSICGADFGMVIVEEKKDEVSVSLRSKPSVDVSVLAKKLGGGGHTQAAGATLYGNFDKTVKKVITSIY